MILALRSGTEVKIPRSMTSRCSFREPDLDLLKPGRVRRREVKRHVGVLGKELLDRCRLVDAHIVEDDVNRVSFGHVAMTCLRKPTKSSAGCQAEWAANVNR